MICKCGHKESSHSPIKSDTDFCYTCHEYKGYLEACHNFIPDNLKYLEMKALEKENV